VLLEESQPIRGFSRTRRHARATISDLQAIHTQVVSIPQQKWTRLEGTIGLATGRNVMKQILFKLSVIAVLASLTCDVCAAERRGRLLRRRPNPPTVRAPRDANHVYRHDPYGYQREYYPRYYGGFHARFFDNYGVPTGDVGVRGNGIYWTPW